MSVSPSVAKALAQGTTVDIFNETDTKTRRKLMERHWSPNINIREPGDKAGSGFDHVEESLAAFKSDGREEWKASFLGLLWVSGNLVSADWEFGPDGKAGDTGMIGKDIFLVGKDGKVETLWVLVQGPSNPD